MIFNILLFLLFVYLMLVAKVPTAEANFGKTIERATGRHRPTQLKLKRLVEKTRQFPTTIKRAVKCVKKVPRVVTNEVRRLKKVPVKIVQVQVDALSGERTEEVQEIYVEVEEIVYEDEIVYDDVEEEVLEEVSGYVEQVYEVYEIVQ